MGALFALEMILTVHWTSPLDSALCRPHSKCMDTPDDGLSCRIHGAKPIEWSMLRPPSCMEGLGQTFWYVACFSRNAQLAAMSARNFPPLSRRM